jgi:hypothetical protein
MKKMDPPGKKNHPIDAATVSFVLPLLLFLFPLLLDLPVLLALSKK